MILTTLGIEWKNRGADGVFVGRNAPNGIEITSTNVPSIGTVYSYNRSFHFPFLHAARISKAENRYYLSIPCMFNKFYLLSFGVSVNKWSKNEIRESLTSVLIDAGLANHFGLQYKVNGLNIGVGELIAGWFEVLSMPRMNVNGFATTVFSGSSLGCTFGMPSLSTILHSKDGNSTQHGFNSEDTVTTFLEMIESYYDYLKSSPDYGESWLNRLYGCLDWASRVRVPIRSNILFYYSYFDLSRTQLEECFDLVSEEKNGLDSVLVVSIKLEEQK